MKLVTNFDTLNLYSLKKVLLLQSNTGSKILGIFKYFLLAQIEKHGKKKRRHRRTGP